MGPHTAWEDGGRRRTPDFGRRSWNRFSDVFVQVTPVRIWSFVDVLFRRVLATWVFVRGSGSPCSPRASRWSRTDTSSCSQIALSRTPSGCRSVMGDRLPGVFASLDPRLISVTPLGVDGFDGVAVLCGSAGVAIGRGRTPHGKTADGAVLQVRPRHLSAPTSPPAPTQNLSSPLSPFSSLGRRPGVFASLDPRLISVTPLGVTAAKGSQCRAGARALGSDGAAHRMGRRRMAPYSRLGGIARVREPGLTARTSTLPHPKRRAAPYSQSHLSPYPRAIAKASISISRSSNAKPATRKEVETGPGVG